MVKIEMITGKSFEGKLLETPGTTNINTENSNISMNPHFKNFIKIKCSDNQIFFLNPNNLLSVLRVES